MLGAFRSSVGRECETLGVADVKYRRKADIMFGPKRRPVVNLSTAIACTNCERVYLSFKANERRTRLRS